MDETTTTPASSPLLGAGWSDPLEEEVRGRVRAFIEAILEEELSAALGRERTSGPGMPVPAGATATGKDR